MNAVLADARYSVTVPANTSAAVAFAVKKKKLPRVLVEPILSPGENEGESDLFFGSLFCGEITVLKQMPVMEWIKNYFQKYDLPRVDSLDDLLAIEGLEELWLWLSMPYSGIEKVIALLRQNFAEENRIVLASRLPLPKGLPFRCADPTGARDFLLCSGSWKERFRYSSLWKKSVVLRSNGQSALRTQVIL
ncbi:MAG: hypothetical protein ACOY3I_01305 [Verrucomicrobiota bacterium]